ncbi:hypothetical protein LX77_02839 [Gelidibacter algens]|jgi:hypothetical protein|uniref:Uncharacterized protein n=1 Tax=Gelidibacter algens TaxID=49280 RepID=A0A1A7R0G4_9FLAO|nr:hypothetical protein [Gelidibacter algens]OBX25740.1 hypothetical protein A9996_08305 [Gelidibacter algens]RAJ21085.1 hypothetical protein LX77_02839 [Gelidibacter algens]
MKANYLFPNRFKQIGWFMLIPSAIIGLVTLIYEYEPNFLDYDVPAIFIDELLGNKQLFGMVSNNILNEIFGVLIIISSLLVAFSKEKLEDEYISKIRLESLVWAVYVNYGILLFSFLFIFDFSFLWVMIFNMYTVLLFFIVRFNWQISKLKKSASYEE